MTAFDRLKLLCDNHGISVNDLEDRIGIGKNSLYSWKKNTPKGTNLLKVADYFNVSTDYLLGRTDNPSIDKSEPEDEFATFFRINTEGMSDEEKVKLQEELKEYFEFMKNRLKNK